MAYADDVVEEETDEGNDAGIRKVFGGEEIGIERKEVEDSFAFFLFRKKKERKRKMEWWWRRERIEKVREFKYLGYVFQKNGGEGGASKRKGKERCSSYGEKEREID